MSCFWKRSTVVIALSAVFPLLRGSSLQAACVGFEDFTHLYGNNCVLDTANYYAAPHNLSPDPNGLWDCFGNCGAGSEVQIISDPAGGGNQVVQITGGTFSTTNPNSDDIITRRTLLQSNSCADGTFTISLRIKAGSGTGTLWRIRFGTGSTTLARLQGTGTSFVGKAGASVLSSGATLTGPGTFDTVVVRVDTVANTAEYFFDANSDGSFVSLGKLNHGATPDGTGNSIGHFEIERVNASSGSVILDDIRIESCRECHTNAAPVNDQNVSGVVSGPVTPAAITYIVQNYGTQSVTYTAQETNAAGTVTDHSWMGLSSGGGTLVNTGNTQNIVATFNTTGLAAGVYTGYIKFTESSCTGPLTSYLRRINLFVGVPVSCFSEFFDALSAGPLNGQGGWTGDATAMDVVAPGNGGSGNGLQLSLGDFPGTTLQQTMACAPCTDGGVITVTARVKSNGTPAGGGNAWRMWITSTSGVDFARWQGQAGNCVLGRIGGTGTVTPCTPLSGGAIFDELKVVIDTISDTSEFFINNISIGKFAHGADVHASQANVSNSVGSITFERINRGDVSGTVTVDDVQVVSCPTLCGVRILPDQTGGSGVGRPVNYGTTSAAVQGDVPDPGEWDFIITNVSPSPLTYSVVESDINGTPTDHSWIELNNTGGTLGLDEDDRVNAILNTTGLAPGEYVGFLKFTDSCSPANTYSLRTLRLVVIEPDTATAGHTCLIDTFSVPNGTLNFQAGWSGTAGTAIQVVNGQVRIAANPSGDVASVGAVTDVPDACVVQADCINQNSIISVKMKMQAGDGTDNIWQITFVSDNGSELGRFYRTGSVVAGRVGSFVTGDVALTAGPGFDELEARINVSDIQSVGGIPPNTTKFYINGIPFPGSPAPCGQTPPPNPVNPICHAGAGDIVTQISVQRTAGVGTAFITLDDVQVDYCVPTCNDPVFDVRDQVNAPAADTFVDLHDLEFGFKPCVTGPTPGPGVFGSLSAECRCMDVTGDFAIDINDFGVFQRCYSGSVAPADPACDD